MKDHFRSAHLVGGWTEVMVRKLGKRLTLPDECTYVEDSSLHALMIDDLSRRVQERVGRHALDLGFTHLASSQTYQRQDNITLTLGPKTTSLVIYKMLKEKKQ